MYISFYDTALTFHLSKFIERKSKIQDTPEEQQIKINGDLCTLNPC